MLKQKHTDCKNTIMYNAASKLLMPNVSYKIHVMNKNSNIL